MLQGLHDNAAGVLLLSLEKGKGGQLSGSYCRIGWDETYLGVEHLALSTQAVTLRDQAVNLLASLQDALDGLVEDNLGLVQLLLDLHDAVGGVGVLVLDNVLLELRKG